MQTKRFLSLLLALAMMFSLAVTASAEEETAEKPLEGQIVILHTNDVHGAIAGYAKAAALKKCFQDLGAYTLLLDAGDYIQGDPVVSVSQGRTAIEMMNLAGYDAATIGNHEFDYGYDNMQALAKEADFPIVSANVRYNGKTENPHTTFTAPDGTKIGVFGLTTPEAATKAHPAKIVGVAIPARQVMFDIAQAEVDALKADGCDYIVCLGHLGIDDESVGNRSIDLLEKVTGIDVFLDGHSHSTLEATAAAAGETVETAAPQGAIIPVDTPSVNAAKGDTLIASTGTKLENIGQVVLNDGGCFARSIPLDSIALDGQADVAARAAAIQKEIDDDYGAVFARTDVLLNGDKEPGNRTEETNLGDLITDALAWGAAKNGEVVDAAVTNGGGIRAPIQAGDITKKDVNTVLPFGNTLSIVKVTGAELLEALEASTYCTPTAVGGFPQVSGIEFTIDISADFDAGDLYPGGSTYHKPASINRVSIQTVGGSTFDKNATYSIATNDFLAAGGDTYYAFAAATANYDLGLPMDEVLMDYITDKLGGTVGSAYAEPAGRITITEAAPAEEPVPTPAPEEPEPAPAPAPAPKPEPAPAPAPTPAPAPAPATGVEAVPAPAPAPAAVEGDYVVKSGDCLWSIAQKAYGTGRQWQLIYNANKDTIKDPNSIRIGQVLVIPAA